MIKVSVVGLLLAARFAPTAGTANHAELVQDI